MSDCPLQTNGIQWNLAVFSPSATNRRPSLPKQKGNINQPSLRILFPQPSALISWVPAGVSVLASSIEPKHRGKLFATEPTNVKCFV